MMEQAMLLEAMISEKMPRGFRFHPNERELVFGYFLDKVTHNLSSAESLLIQERNLYDEVELSEIFATAKDNTKHYFFTQLMKKSPNRFSRTVGHGSWRTIGTDDPIFDCRKGLKGEIRNLEYVNKTLPNQNNAWTMKQYSIHGDSLQHQNVLKDYVLCVIKKKTSCSSSSKRRRLRQNEDFHDEQGNCLQNKDDEINARELDISKDDYLNCNEEIQMPAQPVTYSEDINNVAAAAAAAPQQEGTGTMHENQQFPSHSDGLFLYEASMSPGDPFDPFDGLF